MGVRSQPHCRELMRRVQERQRARRCATRCGGNILQLKKACDMTWRDGNVRAIVEREGSGI